MDKGKRIDDKGAMMGGEKGSHDKKDTDH